MSSEAPDLPLDHGGPTIPFEPFPESAENASVGERLQAVARRYPDSLAIRDGETSLNFAQLTGLVNRIAAGAAAAVSPPGVVAVLLPHSYRFVAAGTPRAMPACRSTPSTPAIATAASPSTPGRPRSSPRARMRPRRGPCSAARCR